jgi:hypothetical protein
MVNEIIWYIFQGPVVENISKRCGGFLKSLSLRGCQSITDGALKYVYIIRCLRILRKFLSGSELDRISTLMHDIRILHNN